MPSALQVRQQKKNFFESLWEQKFKKCELNEKLKELFDWCIGWYFLMIFLDIDLNDPEVEAAAAKIQSAFKNRKGFGKKWFLPWSPSTEMFSPLSV